MTVPLPANRRRRRPSRARAAPSQEGGCTPTFILFCNGEKVFDYTAALSALGAVVGQPALAPRRFRPGEPVADLDCTLFDLPLAGTVQIQVHQQPPPGKAMTKRTHLAGAWFHTGFIARNYLYFGRHVLDRACKDKKGVFAPGFAVELLIERGGGVAGPQLGGADAAAAALGFAADEPAR